MNDPIDPLCTDTVPGMTGTGPVLAVPSGQPVTLMDVVWNAPGPEGPTLRFRFLAPQIAREGGTVDFATAAGDMHHLCQTYALPRAGDYGPLPALIVISLSDRAVVFGHTVPGATQYFDAFSLQGDACIWENI